MRDIKFRAWDEKTKSMVNIQTLHLGEKLKIEHDKSEWDWYKNQISIMQYTGLKDRNGMDIFEGDVIRLRNGQLTEIYYQNGCFMISRLTTVSLHENKKAYLPQLLCNEAIDSEILGNIYENPELLSNQDSSKTP